MVFKAVFYIANIAVLLAIAHIFWWGWGLPDPRHPPRHLPAPAPAPVEVGEPA